MPFPSTRMKAKSPGNGKEDYATSATARIRENQRRSRTRRKEYVQHLEQRLWSFERLGVAATQEVQKAGRKVARENDLLRSLLLLHGLTETSIEEYLESRGQPTSSTPSQRMPVASLAPAKLHPLTAPSKPPEDYDHSPTAPSHCDLDNPPHQLRATGSRNSSLKSDTKTCKEILPRREINAHREDKVDPVTAESTSESHQSGSIQDRGQFTSCATAARIIENMHNQSDFCDVRSELGCGSKSTCMVKNTSIFDILDK